MKARTKFQSKVEEANKALPQLSEKVIEWAFEKVLTHYAFRREKGKTICLDCNHQWQSPKEGLSKCPCCGRKVKIVNTAKRQNTASQYFSTLSVVNDMQVQRIFRIDVKFRTNEKPSFERFAEVCRLWISQNGDSAVTSRMRTYSYFVDAFNYGSAIELRNLQNIHIALSDCPVYPHFSLLSTLRRNGMTRKLPLCTPYKYMVGLLNDPRIETLAKACDFAALSFFTEHPYELDKCWKSYLLARRGAYKVIDMHLWCDLIRTLESCSKDILSPKYVCPTNLKAAHDYWVKKHAETIKRKRETERKERMMKSALSFLETKSKYFDISFGDDTISISVLKSIDEYEAEGNAMHHCVFAANYFEKPNSIILSARDKNGKRIETIEFSLEKLEVLQSRGVCNSNTEYHERIVDLVNNNAHLFAEIRETA